MIRKNNEDASNTAGGLLVIVGIFTVSVIVLICILIAAHFGGVL